MRFPKKIFIAGDEISIKMVKNLKGDEGESVDGKYSPKTMEIFIDSDLKPHEKVHTFFHEYFHALCDSLGLGNCDFSHDLEEILADNLGKQLSKTFNITFKK